MKRVFFTIGFALILIIGGIKTIVTKEINGGKIYFYLDDYANIYGGIFILIGVIILINIFSK